MLYNRIRAADLNLLILFQALMDEKNISRAAEKMNLTQPAMSRALQRLKHLFKDDLLVRTSNGYEATARAQTIKAELDTLFPRIEELLQTEKFRPEKQRGTLKIAATDFGSSSILPGFLSLLKKEAPLIELNIKHWHSNTFHRLESGALDLALWANTCPPNLKSEILFRDELVCLVDRNHPLTKGAVTLKRYLSYPHIAVAIRNGRQEPIDQFLSERRVDRNITVRTPYSVSASILVQDTDLVLTLPSRFVERLASTAKVVQVAAPKELPILDYIQIWHPRVDQDPYSVWVRALMKSACI